MLVLGLVALVAEDGSLLKALLHLLSDLSRARGLLLMTPWLEVLGLAGHDLLLGGEPLGRRLAHGASVPPQVITSLKHQGPLAKEVLRSRLVHR